MTAAFRNLTLRDLAGLSHRARAAARRQHVRALFEEIQMAIRDGDRPKIDDLMAELAEAAAQDYRAELRDH